MPGAHLREDSGGAIFDLVQDALHDTVHHASVVAAENSVCPHRFGQQLDWLLVDTPLAAKMVSHSLQE